MPDSFSNSQKALLSLARQAIRVFLENKSFPSLSETPPEFLIKRGCFVTLKKSGMLRGCIGTFDATESLAHNVMRMAIAAATEDYRFASVELSELNQIRIEISILGEPVKMNSIEELVIGKHGIIVQYQNRRGVYLPEVAVEQNWKAHEFITHCGLHKAGIRQAELDRAEVHLFEVEKIADE